MNFRRLFTVLALSALAATAFAQESNKDAEGNTVRHPYLTNGFGDNWFIGAAGGVNTFIAKDNENKITPEFEVTVGKWFTPSVGMRLGFSGLRMKEVYKGDFHHHFTPAGHSADKAEYTYGYAYAHGDLMWNISNAIGGYKENRFFEFIPYVHTGLVHIYDVPAGFMSASQDNELSLGFGLIGKMRFTNRLFATIDIRQNAFSSRFHNWNNGGIANNYSAALGLGVVLGKTNWSRPEVCHASEIQSALDAANAALAAAQAANAALASELEALKNAPVVDTTPAVDPGTVLVPYALGVAPLTLYYEIRSTELNATERRHLDEYIKAILAQEPDRKFTLTGSADKGTGTPEINARLVVGRAQGVKDILMKDYGVKEANITVTEGKITDENEDPRFDRSVIIVH